MILNRKWRKNLDTPTHIKSEWARVSGFRKKRKGTYMHNAYYALCKTFVIYIIFAYLLTFYKVRAAPYESLIARYS